MSKRRLDLKLVGLNLVLSRSQAANYIKLGRVKVNGVAVTKAGALVGDDDEIELLSEQYISRAGLKLASVAKSFGLNFKGKTMLDVGSSTGGFTDYALQHGAKKVWAVDVGTNQLHPKLRQDPRVELHEKTDIRSFKLEHKELPDLIVIDVSFISLRKVLPHLYYKLSKKFVQDPTLIVAMLKPQFETEAKNLHKGVVKNSKLRRQICADFELWARRYFVITDKQDSAIAGQKGNLERFYLLKVRC